MADNSDNGGSCCGGTSTALTTTGCNKGCKCGDSCACDPCDCSKGGCNGCKSLPFYCSHSFWIHAGIVAAVAVAGVVVFKKLRN